MRQKKGPAQQAEPINVPGGCNWKLMLLILTLQKVSVEEACAHVAPIFPSFQVFWTFLLISYFLY